LAGILDKYNKTFRKFSHQFGNFHVLFANSWHLQ